MYYFIFKNLYQKQLGTSVNKPVYMDSHVSIQSYFFITGLYFYILYGHIGW